MSEKDVFKIPCTQSQQFSTEIVTSTKLAHYLNWPDLAQGLESDKPEIPQILQNTQDILGNLSNNSQKHDPGVAFTQ